MADFPASIYTAREIENLPGIDFDSTKKQVLFAEDVQGITDEITAIESTLGENPQGSFDTVVAWLSSLASDVASLLSDFSSFVSSQWTSITGGIYFDGFVGIGTTNPLKSLHVEKNYNNGTEIIVKNTTAGAAAQAAIHIESDVGYTGFFKYSSSRSSYKTAKPSDVIFYNSAGGDIDVLNDNSSGNINFAAGGSSVPQLMLLSSGKVGIGTSTPSSMLSVVGLPTSASGLAAGDIWVDTTGGLNILKIV